MWRTPLIQKHRLAARLALYLSPVFFALLVWGVVEVAGRLGLDMGWHGEDFSEIGSVQLFREYLRIDSSYPDGNEIPAAEFLARHLEAAGIPATVERLGRRNANVWAILEGEDPEALVLHNHIDVEPADQSGWRHPPFGGVLDPPFIYGRGAFDMKSYGIAQLLAMLEMRERGGLRRSLIFLGTGSEETDSRLGTIWMLREHPELVSRFWAVLTEGGAVEAIHVEEVKYWGTEFGQKHFADVWVCDASRERLELLRQDLLAAEAPMQTPSGAVTRFLERYAATRDNPRIRRALRHPRQLPDEIDAAVLPPYLQAMIRDEVVPFPIEADPGGGYRMRVILHMLPDTPLEEAWDELLAGRLEGFSYTVDVTHGASPPSPLDHEVFRTIDRYMAERLPEVPHGPLFVPWSATDSRFFRAAGIPSYGYSPFLILSMNAIKMKGANERIAAPAFVDGVELYAGLVERLVG
jgi:acetylornithine deacetylase/succinyl-diaminopimelate desuccinylase-like protein